MSNKKADHPPHSSLRSLPSVEALLQNPQAQSWIELYGRPLTLDALRSTLDEARSAYTGGAALPRQDELLQRVGALLQNWTAPTLQGVINAAGVILHTNLGRAPLSAAVLEAVQTTALGYSTLEYDLQTGKRGSRSVHAEALLRRITRAEAALVVNNNAAALLLALSALAKRRAVVIARSQLVEIGGGFRVPDVMKQSGARLLEVGTTNRVHLSDYQAALGDNPALFLRAHRSNFQIIGFTTEPSLDEIAAVAHSAGLALLDDLGSGALLDTARYGLAHEPTVQESLAAGADLVCFSGDKLLGGPQAGIIVGRAALIDKLKKHPLARAIRADKLCLAALSATLLHYLKNEAETSVPIWRMIAARPDDLRARAESWQAALGCGEVIPGQSTVGGGSLPGETLPTFLLALRPASLAPASMAPASLAAFMQRLRRAVPPVIARLENDRVLLDPRTVLPEQQPALLAALRPLLASSS